MRQMRVLIKQISAQTKCYYLYDLLIPLHFHLQNNKFVYVRFSFSLFFFSEEDCLIVCLFVYLCVYLSILTTSDEYLCVVSIAAFAYCENGNHIFWFSALPFVVIILMFVHFLLLPFDFSFIRWVWQTICLLFIYLFVCLYERREWMNKNGKMHEMNFGLVVAEKKNNSRYAQNVNINMSRSKFIRMTYCWDILWVTEKSVSFQTIAHYNFYGFYMVGKYKTNKQQ